MAGRAVTVGGDAAHWSMGKDAVGRLGGKWQARLAVGAAACVLGQAMLYHREAPFVWVFLVLLWQFRRESLTSGIIGGALGALLAGGWPSLALVCGGGLALWTTARMKRPEWLAWPLVGMGAGAMFLFVRLPVSPELWVLAGLVAGGSVMLYGASVREIDRYRTGIGDQRTLVLVVVALGALVAGLEGWVVGPVEPSLVMGGLMILAGAAVGQAAGGAVAGATFGFTLAVRGTDPGGGIGFLVAAGFAAGWAQQRHWRLAPVGLAAGIVLYAILVRVPTRLTEFWLSLGLAALLFELIPEPAVRLGQTWAACLLGEVPRETFADRLERFADVMGEMARAFRLEDETSNREAAMVEQVIESVCRKCSLYRTCWSEDFYRSYRGVTAVLTGDDKVQSPGPRDFSRRCIRPDAVAEVAGQVARHERERAEHARRIRESRALAEMQLAGLADLIRQMAEGFGEVDGPDRPTGAGRIVLDFSAGVAKRPRRGGAVSGDSDLRSDLSDHRVVFGLSDGMGAGSRAAWESGTAMALMEQLLKAGFSQPLAVRAVNTTLMLRAVDDHFATLDLVVINRVAATAEFVKVAAAPTFVCRGRRVEVIRSQSLPVGIVPDVRFEPVARAIEPGDVIVMVTDGVLEHGEDPAEVRLERLLKEIASDFTDATAMAETILSYMLGGTENGRDDAAVMVVRASDHRSAVSAGSADSAGGRVGEWRRVTPPRPARRGLWRGIS